MELHLLDSNTEITTIQYLLYIIKSISIHLINEANIKSMKMLVYIIMTSLEIHTNRIKWNLIPGINLLYVQP